MTVRVWNRYKVTWSYGEGGVTFMTQEIVSQDFSLEHKIQERWPNDYCDYYQYELVEENVKGPEQVGHILGQPIFISGWIGNPVYNPNFTTEYYAAKDAERRTNNV